MLGCFYVLFVEGDIEPSLIGPFRNPEDRDNEAIRLKREHGDEHGIFMLDIDTIGRPSVDAYSGGFFEDALQRDEDD